MQKIHFDLNKDILICCKDTKDEQSYTCILECSEKGVEPADHSPQTEYNVKKSYELNSKRINHCYIYKPKVECTYVS